MPHNEELLKQTDVALQRAINDKKSSNVQAERSSLISAIVGELKEQRSEITASVVGELKDVLADVMQDAQRRRNEEDRQSLIEGLGAEFNKVIQSSFANIKVPPIIVPTPVIGDIKVPEVKIPPIKIPIAKIPKPEITVNIPKQEAPKLTMPEMLFPTEMGIAGVDNDRPLPVRLMGEKGKPFVFSFPSGGGGGQRLPTDSTGRISTKQNIIAGGSRNTTITITDSSTLIATENLNRESLTISNDSAEVVYISLGGSAATSVGHRLNSDGGAIAIGQNTSIPWGGAVFGIVNSDTTRTVLTIEF